jgi:hypothetical protein
MRKPTSDELRLLEHLVAKATFVIDGELLVEDMNDGGMGSLLLFAQHSISRERRFGRQVADCRFVDADGVDVIASLNLDEDGELFELDVWKVNYAPLIRIAERFSSV